MLKQRIITALVVVAAMLAALLLLSPINFCLLIAVIVCYGAWEWSNLAGMSSPLARLLYVGLTVLSLWGVAALLDFYAVTIDREIALQLLFSSILWWLIALALIASYPRTESFWQPLYIRALMGLCVLIPPWIALVVLMKTGVGEKWLLIVIAIVALADIGAYFSGKKYGRRKLAVNVSPGKTFEGLAGGLIVSLLFAVLLAGFRGYQQTQWLWLLSLVLVTVLASVVGDLLESMVKRSRGVKDSGAVLPGHGGLLDRIDSLTAALPVFTFAMLLSGDNTLL